MIKYQISLSFIFVFTLFISILLSYNSMLTLEKKEALLTDEDALKLLRINRFISFLVATGFVFINMCDQKIKKKYSKESVNSDLQILSSVVTLIASLIVLFVAFNSDSTTIDNENPES